MIAYTIFIFLCLLIILKEFTGVDVFMPLERLVRRLKQKKNNIKRDIKKGIEVTQQMKAEKQRKKLQNMKMAEPGTIKFGLTHQQHPFDLMKDTYAKRKEKRREKEDKKN